MGRTGSGGGSSHSSSFHSSSHTSSVHHSSPSPSFDGTSWHSSAPSRAGRSDYHDGRSDYHGFGGHGRSPVPPRPSPSVIVYTAAQNTAGRSSYSSRTNYGSQENWDYPWGKPSSAKTDKKEDKWPTIYGVLIFLIIDLGFLAGLFTFMWAFHGSADTSTEAVANTRQKLTTSAAFQNGCIVDELDWFDDVSKTESRLENFYDKTGIQPYIVLFDYNADIETDEGCQKYADEYYKANIDNESTLLFAYFAEEDTDNDVGAMVLINGKQVDSIMDSEATNIFWNNTDKYWYTDLSTDDMFVKIFNDTANTIMPAQEKTVKESTFTLSKNDCKHLAIISLANVIIVGTIFIYAAVKRQRSDEE